MWAKIITIKRTKDLNYFSLCAFNLFNTQVSQFELNYWNKWTFTRHSNLLRSLLGRVILYYGFFRTENSKLGPGGLVSCRVQLQPLSNTPETANLSIVETFRQVCWGKLELNSAGHRPSRTEFGHPALEQVTSSRMGTCWFFFYTYVARYL